MKVRTFFFVCFMIALGFLSTAAISEPPTGINLGHDYTFKLVDGDLTSTGVQYSVKDTTTTATVAINLYTLAFDIDFGNTRAGAVSKKYLIDLYLEIYGSFASKSTATADVEWKPQARNKDGTWTDLADYVDLADVNTTFTDSNLKGHVTLSDTIDEIPFDFRILMKCDEADEGIGRIKSGSYIRATFKDITWGL